uniref:Uncharacterized protein n=1 Tax=Arundo donax TaxID=35708 RepID=A0A0A9EZ11_ARUDO
MGTSLLPLSSPTPAKRRRHKHRSFLGGGIRWLTANIRPLSKSSPIDRNVAPPTSRTGRAPHPLELRRHSRPISIFFVGGHHLLFTNGPDTILSIIDVEPYHMDQE